MLSNPGKATKSRLAGIAHVVAKMEWYCALSVDLLKKDNVATTKKSLSLQEVVELLKPSLLKLYKALLLYQMKSVCSFYKHQGLVFMEDLTTLHSWDGSLNDVDEAEGRLLKDWDTCSKIEVKTLLSGIFQDLGLFRQDVREFFEQQRIMQRADRTNKCLKALCRLNPRDDMQRLEREKEPLIPAAYQWILKEDKYEEFANWNDSSLPKCQLLWVNGEPGTGKTMLLMGIIRELSGRPHELAPSLSYFFCQSADKALSNTEAILRSLIWMLVIQQQHLIPALQAEIR